METPTDLGQQVQLPSGHWRGERAATDVLVLARKGRAFRSLDTLVTRQSGQQVLYGSALALAAALQTWANNTGTSVLELTRTACWRRRRPQTATCSAVPCCPPPPPASASGGGGRTRRPSPAARPTSAHRALAGGGGTGPPEGTPDVDAKPQTRNGQRDTVSDPITPTPWVGARPPDPYPARSGRGPCCRVSPPRHGTVTVRSA